MMQKIFPAERMHTDYPWQLWAVGWLAIFKAILCSPTSRRYPMRSEAGRLEVISWGRQPFLVCGVGL